MAAKKTKSPSRTRTATKKKAAAPKKAAPKKAAPKKAAPKKPASKKAPARKPASRKAPAKKPAPTKAPAAKAPKAFLALCSSKVVGPKRKDILFAYRQKPDNAEDSGWRFLRGDESQAFLDDAENCLVCPLSLVLAMDDTLEALMSRPAPSAWKRTALRAKWEELPAYQPE